MKSAERVLWEKVWALGRTLEHTTREAQSMENLWRGTKAQNKNLENLEWQKQLEVGEQLINGRLGMCFQEVKN